MTKTIRSSEIFAVKMDIFPEKRHSEILIREKFLRSPKLGARSPPLSTMYMFVCLSFLSISLCLSHYLSLYLFLLCLSL